MFVARSFLPILNYNNTFVMGNCCTLFFKLQICTRFCLFQCMFFIGQIVVHLLDMSCAFQGYFFFWGGDNRIHYCWSNPFGKIERVGKQNKKMCIISNIG
jgi:hypothetical protein